MPQPPYTGGMEVLYGLHPVEEALRARPEAVDHISVAREREGRRGSPAEPAAGAGPGCPRPGGLRAARAAGPARPHGDAPGRGRLPARAPVCWSSRTCWRLRRTAPGGGFSWRSTAWRTRTTWALCCARPTARASPECILPERRSAPLSAVVAKTSAGASEHVRIARVTNLTRALEQMKKQHIWIVGLDERGHAGLHRLRSAPGLLPGARPRGRRAS